MEERGPSRIGGFRQGAQAVEDRPDSGPLDHRHRARGLSQQNWRRGPKAQTGHNSVPSWGWRRKSEAGPPVRPPGAHANGASSAPTADNDGGASASQAASNGFIGQFPMTVVPLT